MTEYEGIISVLRALVSGGNYSLVDRIANALNRNAIEQALYDALRTVDALSRRAIRVKVKVDDKEEVLEIIDWSDDLEDPRYFKAEKGQLIEVISPGISELKNLRGRKIKFIRKPKMPSEEEVQRFLRALDLGILGLREARRVATKALLSS